MPHPLGVLISLFFIVTLGLTLSWMLRLPRPMAQEVARAVYSVGAARCILVPILDLFYTERAVELACRLGRQQGATIVLAYVVEVPRLLTLDSPLPAEVDKRALDAMKHAQSIVKRHDLPVTTTTIRAREASEKIGEAVKIYQADVIVLGIQTAEHRVPGIFTRTADALTRRPPCEVLIDSVPETVVEKGE
jgi:nucleotide-binding universal stress UspA family protein